MSGFAATDEQTQKALAADMQRQAFVDAPCMPVGLYYQPVAYRADLIGMMKGLIFSPGSNAPDLSGALGSHTLPAGRQGFQDDW